jgi:hypothetical protein
MSSKLRWAEWFFRNLPEQGKAANDDKLDCQPAIRPV